MIEFILDYIENVFKLIQLDYFAIAFMGFVGLFSVYLIRYVVWGK